MESLHDAHESIDGTCGQKTQRGLCNGHVRQEENIADLAVFRVVMQKQQVGILEAY